MDRIDDLLSLIEKGLQSSSERGEPQKREGSCLRACTGAAVDGSEFCAPCRAFLLGDLEEDPADGVERPTLDIHSAEFREALRRYVDQPMVEQLAAGKAHLWLESGETLTGTEAVDYIRERYSG